MTDLQRIVSLLVATTFFYVACKGALRGQDTLEETRKCKDIAKVSHCLYFKRYGGCKSHEKRMRKICPKTCNFCVPKKQTINCKDTVYGCCNDGVSPASGPNLQGCQDECMDKYGEAFCRTIERLGGCGTGKSGIGKKCMKTCRMCRSCKDNHFSKCQRWKRFYGCSQKLVRMNNHCRRTCGYCGKKDPCFGHFCPKHHHCKVSKNLQPLCVCNFHCRQDDNRTGLLCGRDGNEYQNLCELKKESCRSQKPIAVKKYGPCKQPVFVKTCSDAFEEHPRCDLWVKHQTCRTHKKLMSKWCPRSCGFCKAAFDPHSLPCYNTRYGCCPDRSTPCSSPGCDQCPKTHKCKDRAKTLCNRFGHACGMERNKSVMRMLCPKTCQYCVKIEHIEG